MTVTVRLFANPRERAGETSIEMELDEGATVAEALDRLSERPSSAICWSGCPCGWP